VKNEVNVLILEDRPIGLESLQDNLRRVQLFPFFSFAATAQELQESLSRQKPDLILFVERYFQLSLDEILHALQKNNYDTPVIVIASAAKLSGDADRHAIEMLRNGANDFLFDSELARLPRAIYLALRDRNTMVSGRLEEREGEASGFGSMVLPPIQNRPDSSTLIEYLIDIVTELDVVGTILYESPSILPVLGYTQEELIGRNAFSLIHPLDVPRVLPVFMVALASPGIPHSARFRFKHVDGSWRTLESVGKAIMDESGARKIVVTSRDITEQRREHIVLGDNEARFMAVVEGLGEGVLITDTSDKILYSNKRMAELTGYEVQELLGKRSYQIFLPEEAWEVYMQQKTKWLLGNREEYEITILRSDRSPICMHVNISPYRNSEGHIVGTLAAFIDITNRKRSEEEVQKAFAHLQAAKDHAEEMNRLKTTFLANISHEIRTPMTSILGFASVLTESLTGTEYEEYASMIEESGKRLLDTINGILDLAKVESNKVDLSPTLVPIDHEIKTIIKLLEPQAERKGLGLSIETSGNLQAYLDKHYFGRILLNLIANAIKFTEHGIVTVTAHPCDAEGMMEIKVIDTGIGISENFLPYLFDEFKQESVGWGRNYEGTGLGLTITKRLVELMGGSIQVESIKGAGSTFTVCLPINLNGAFAHRTLKEKSIAK
jgi:PAS domain S-box-containing protein